MIDKYKCPICKGEPVPDKVVNNVKFVNCICEFCQGKEELTWIENIFGVDPDYRFERIEKLFDTLTFKK